jgi:hypothetical protein
MALIYDQDTGQWVDDGTTTYYENNGQSSSSDWTPPPDAVHNTDGTYTQTMDDGSTMVYNSDGSIRGATNSDGTPYNPGSNPNLPANSISTTGIQGLLSGLSKATGIPSNLLSPAALTTAAGVAALLGGNQTKTALSNVSIPNLVAVNQPINPGQAGQGQAYFTPTQFVTPDKVAAAQAQAAKDAALMTPVAPQQQQLPAANIGTAWSHQGAPVQAITPFTNPQPTGIAQVATPQQIQNLQSQVSNLQQNPAGIMNLGRTVNAAHGGAMPSGIATAAHGRYLRGSTDGMADKLDTSIDGVQPAKLSHGEFVIPADVVSHLGNGNSDAGAQKLYHMMDKIRMARTGTKKQGKQINPDKFMPGGIAGYATGGDVKGFAAGSVVSSPTSVSGLGTSTVTGLNDTFAPTVANMVAKQAALTNAPAPVYTGELAAGPSALQNQYFANANQIAQTGLTPTQFTSGTFNTQAANQYMNPYLQASLDPQLAALQRTAQIGQQADLSKLTQAGAYGGTRQAVLQGQDAYNLLAQQANLIGQGYNTAYNNAMNQFNTANRDSLTAQQNQEAANEAAANFGLASNQALGTAGTTQQAIKQAQDTASLNQFNQQNTYLPTQLSNLNSMLSTLPISSAATTPNTSTLATIAGDLSGLTGIFEALGGKPTNTTGSSGTTGTGGGTTSDIRAKQNIELIEVRPDGLNVYEFEYKPEFKNWPTAGHGRFRGLMAHEVEKVYPDAVTMISGYKAVDYSKVGF